MDRCIKRDRQKREGTAGLFPFPFAFRTRRTKSFQVFVWLCKDFLCGDEIRVSPGNNRGRTTYRDTKRIDSRRLFLFFFDCCFFEKNLSLSSNSHPDLKTNEDIPLYRIRDIRQDDRRHTDDKPTSAFYLSIVVCMCMYMCAGACVHVMFSVSIVFGISTWAENGERKLYIGTSKKKKKVYFTIPLAVEDREIYYLQDLIILHREERKKQSTLFTYFP